MVSTPSPTAVGAAAVSTELGVGLPTADLQPARCCRTRPAKTVLMNIERIIHVMSARHNAYGTRSRLGIPERTARAPELNRVNIMRGKNHIRTKLSNSLYGEVPLGQQAKHLSKTALGQRHVPRPV